MKFRVTVVYPGYIEVEAATQELAEGMALNLSGPEVGRAQPIIHEVEEIK